MRYTVGTRVIASVIHHNGRHVWRPYIHGLILIVAILSMSVHVAAQSSDLAALEERLLSTPILSNMDTERLAQIFALGQALGNRADVFTTIGDSNTTNGDFLQPIGIDGGDLCAWGDYAALRETVAYFSTPPTDTAANSFSHAGASIAAFRGFTTAAVLDPFWATDPVCARGESPLACEYRVARPSVAVMMLGGRDVLGLTADDYRQAVTEIVQTSIAQGVIPVLTTFVVLEDRVDVYPLSLEMNMALLDIAEEAQIPLINLWAAAAALPDHGIGPDRSHLKARVGDFCDFDGAETELGGTLRNLLTLQALDALRVNVLTTS